MEIDSDLAYRAVAGRDRRFDGVFFTGVRSTGIYCRPSCPARTPRRENVSFHRTAAAAQAAGFRACRRCLPDATPGSPEWDVVADTAGRAMRLIADGVVDREGVPGLAVRLGYSQRQLGRILETELGAGPLALARAQRAQRARVLVETTTWPLADIAYAAGFASLRQFNATFREVYAIAPGELRSHRGLQAVDAKGTVQVRIPVRTPFAGGGLLGFLSRRAVPGVEEVEGSLYRRAVRLPRGPAVLSVRLEDVAEAGGVHRVPCRFVLSDLRDLSAAMERCRRLLDADCDPLAVDTALAGDSLLADSVRTRPGLRVPGHVDGDELAVRVVLGQQVSVHSATAAAGRLVALVGEELPESLRTPGVSRLFPSAGAVADLDPGWFRGPRSRAEAVRSLAAALASGEVRLDRGQERARVRERLLALPGVGPWTAGVVAMRALGDPDVWLPGDVGVRRALSMHRVQDGDADRAGWRPWRSYAVAHLWAAQEDDGARTRGES